MGIRDRIDATYLYLKKRASAHGYPTEIVSGIPSFCAAAAALNIGLVERAQPMVIIPGAYPTEEVLYFPGTKVLMKSGKQLAQVRDQLKNRRLTASMVEHCGLPTEKIYPALQDIPDSAGYLSLIVAQPGDDGRYTAPVPPDFPPGLLTCIEPGIPAFERAGTRSLPLRPYHSLHGRRLRS